MTDIQKRKENKFYSFIIDTIMVNGAIGIAYFFHYRTYRGPVFFSNFYEYFGLFALWYTIVRISSLFFFGLYDKDKELNSYAIVDKIVKSTTLSSLVIFALIHLIRSYYFYDIGISRLVIFYEWSANIFLLLGWRLLYYSYRRQFVLIKKAARDTIVIGINEEIGHFLKMMKDMPYSHWNILGYITDQGQEKQYLDLKNLGVVDNFLEIFNQYSIEHIILCDKNLSLSKLYNIVNQSNALGIRVFITPHLYEVFNGRLKIRQMEEVALFELIAEPISGFNLFMKRAFDIVISLIAIVVALPVMIIIAIAIKLTSQGPIFFKQIRIGKDNKPFMLYKFRSMINGAEQESGPTWYATSDKQVTSIGRFLRRTSLDELPQLFVVLMGNLSIVGPRPERPHYVYKYKDLQGLRLSIVPGITGLAQINGRNDLDLGRKLMYDFYYINNYSIYLDIAIICKTFWIILSRKGA
ncbi:MAG: sugar transferase [bacterium]